MGILYEGELDTIEAAAMILIKNVFTFNDAESLDYILNYFRTAFDASDENALSDNIVPLTERNGARAWMASLVKYNIDSMMDSDGDAFLATAAALINMPRPNDPEWLARLSKRVDTILNGFPSGKSDEAYLAAVKKAIKENPDPNTATDLFGIFAITALTSSALNSRLGQNVIQGSGRRLVALASKSQSGALRAGGGFVAGATGAPRTGLGRAARTNRYYRRGVATRAGTARLGGLLRRANPYIWGAFLLYEVYNALSSDEIQRTELDEGGVVYEEDLEQGVYRQ